MTKQLLSLQTLTRSIIFLVITLLIPTTLWAEDITTYGLTVGGTEVTSANATNVLGNGTVSFTPATDDLPATLTLNNAVLSDNVICNITSLFIDIIGTNSITTDGKPAITTTLEATSPKISIKSTSNPIGSLVLRNTSPETSCGGVVKGNISIHAENPISILLPTFQDFLTMDTTHVAAFGESYNLMVGDVAVSNINASDILGDGKATYNPDKNTLSLNGVTTSMIYCHVPQPLTIEISGTNTVSMISGYGGDENPLFIKKGSSPASLDVNPGDQVLDGMGPICHFSSCTWDEGLYVEAYSDNRPISGAYYEDRSEQRQFMHLTGRPINRVTFSENQPTATPTIWISKLEPNEEGKFTFDGESIPGILFNASNNTLTLQGADLSNGGDIVSSLPNLTIKLDGAMSSLGSNKITSSDPKATLTFTTEEKNPGSLTSNTLPWEGFAGNPTFENKLVYLPNEDSKFIRILEAPFINYSDGDLEFNGLNDGYGNNSFDCHYTITYGDGTTDSGQNNEYGPSLSVEKELKPCSITAYVEFKDIFNNTTRSDIATAKYFGLINNELSVPYQQSTTAPVVFPALPEGVTVRYKNNTETTPTNPIDENGAITINGLGTDLYYAFTTGFNEDRCYEGENGEMITILNDIEPVADIPTCELGQFSLTVEPRDLKDVTIEDISDQTYTGNEIRPELVVKNGDIELQEAKTADDGDYTVSFSNNIAAALSTAENAPSVTITGKGNYTGTATKTFTITALSIENADVVLDNGPEFTYNEAKNVPTIKSASVTIGTSTPEVTAPSIPLTAETDYTISYTKNGEAIDADNIINAGNYKMVLTGKGNFSGTKEIPFTINPRPIESPIVTLSATEFVYNAQAQKPTVTVKFAESAEITKTIPTTDYEVAYSGDCINVGSYTVSVSLKGNYTGTTTATFTITAASMSVSASGYEGAYDGKAHGISVAAPEGATVMYGTQEGTYDLTASPTFTDAGTYQVYYQVSKENYTPVTGSKTVEISKAAGGLAYSAATASAELNGDGWTAPSLSNPHGLDITYSSSNTAVATVSATGAVSLTGIGQTTIKAASTGNKNYAASEAQYVLTVTRGKAKSYGVKIGDTEVNEDNYTDIFGDDGTDDGDHKRVAPSMLFNPEKNTLLIIGSNEGLTIESTLPELNIHLSQDNKLKKVVFNNQGNSANTGKVLFTCDSNFPGKLTIENTEGESAISGFASVGYEFGLQVLAPEDATYKDGKVVNGNGAVVSTLTIGVVLNPLTGDEPDELNPDDFTVTYPDGTTATINLTNNAINNILYTLNNDTEGQGYDPEYNDIGIVTTMTDEVVTQVANDVANSTLIVGSDDYANRFIGLTFIVQGGEGTIKIAQEVEDGYEFHLKIGNNDAVKVADYIITQPNADVPYQLDDATLCWLYLVKKPGASTRMRSTRVNKRSKLMGSIKHVNIKAKTVASTNSATKVSGGIITIAANNALTDIEDTQVDNQSQSSQHNKWYTLDGRQINKPSQKGLYINNKKKVVIK